MIRMVRNETVEKKNKKMDSLQATLLMPSLRIMRLCVVPITDQAVQKGRKWKKNKLRATDDTLLNLREPI